VKPVHSRADAFDVVTKLAVGLPHVEAATRYYGSPVLKVAGVFMAGPATHSSAEPNTLVVRADLDEREWFIEDAPDTYYLTDYYRRYPLILVRLDHVGGDALRELLASSHRLSLPKTRLRTSRSRLVASAFRRTFAGRHILPAKPDATSRFSPPGELVAIRREPPGPRAARKRSHPPR
jgi:hypothetical protein